MAVNERCRRTRCNWLGGGGAHLSLLLVMMTSTLAAVDAQRSYRRRVGLLRSTDHLPTDPWQLFNISVAHTGNKTEGRRRARGSRCTLQGRL